MATKFEELLGAYNLQFQQHKTLKQDCFRTLQSLINSLRQELQWPEEFISLSFEGTAFVDLPKVWEKNLISTRTRPHSQGVWMLWIGFELATRNSLYPHIAAPLTVAMPLFFGVIDNQFRLCIKTDALNKKVFEFYNPPQEIVTEIAEFICGVILNTLSEAIWRNQEKREPEPIKLWTPPADQDGVETGILSIDGVEALAKAYG